MSVATQNPAFVMGGPSSTPLYGIPTPSLGDGSSSGGGFVDDYHHHPMMLEQNNNNKMDVLPGHHHKGKDISDFSQKSMIHPFQASSSMTPSPLFLSNENGLPMSEYQWDIDQRMDKFQNDNANDNIIKGQWTEEEDSALVKLVEKFGPKKWSEIAKLLQGRIGKQCRERWFNHLQPNIKKGPWTLEEDIILIEAHHEIGKKWSEIAKRLPGRPENSIKNHWNSTMRRQNCKRQKNNNDSNYEGSLLHAYVKRVTSIEQATKVLENNNEEHNKSHDVFNGSTSNYVSMQVNNNNNVDGGNINCAQYWHMLR
uniref:Transcription factor MYB98 n=2 Tax=Cajanus cajan TaxID=3821 RepID=A0A151RYP6_CAJCA|nr:Transcription factor MYB98 [Cajanus cajan]